MVSLLINMGVVEKCNNNIISRLLRAATKFERERDT
jgi:hypothetical protein